MKNAKSEYTIVSVLMGLSAVAACVNFYDETLMSENVKIVFKAFLFIGVIWYFMRGRNLTI
jgi:hypothetical protein